MVKLQKDEIEQVKLRLLLIEKKRRLIVDVNNELRVIEESIKNYYKGLIGKYKLNNGKTYKFTNDELIEVKPDEK